MERFNNRTRQEEEDRMVAFVRRHQDNDWDASVCPHSKQVRGVYVLIDNGGSGNIWLDLIKSGRLIETEHGKWMGGLEKFPRNTFVRAL
jgi:hypothetical protein